MPEDDTLARIVSLADAEGLLRAGSLERFVDGLRERGRVILERRILPLERRVEELEKELRWRAELHHGLETENVWRRASMTALEERIAGLEERQAWQAGEIERREAVLAARDAEIRSCREEQAKTAVAHDRLLEHHRTMLKEIADTLAAIVLWLPWSYRRAQDALTRLAATLRQEIP